MTARRRRARASFAAGGVGVAVGAVADAVLPEPGDRLHPVAVFGRAMTRLERRMWRDDRMTGVAFLLAGTIPAAGLGLLLERHLGRTTATALAATMSIGATMLERLASDVADALDQDDLDEGRIRIARLVGRDTSELDNSGVSRAAIESVAENTVDATLAPIFWGAVAGAPGVLAHRAVNTLDAMVGHRSARYRRFGWASARADDLLNWLPARLGAAAMAILHPRQASKIATAVRHDAPAHPSPNGGVIEAAFAAALGVQLGGTNRYDDQTEDRGPLGTGHPQPPPDVRRTTHLARALTTLTAIAASIPAVATARTSSRRERTRHIDDHRLQLS